jgi:hypothetical protein
VTNWKINLQGQLRQIVNIPNIDACPALANIDKFPMFKIPADRINQTFPGFFHPCPYKVISFLNDVCYSIQTLFILKEFKVVNASMVPHTDRPNWVKFPNGKYKNSYMISDELDDNIFTLNYWSEESFHFGSSEF